MDVDSMSSGVQNVTGSICTLSMNEGVEDADRKPYALRSLLDPCKIV